MKQINSEILINAPIEKVWTVLTDFDAYSTWNPFIIKIDGECALNKQITISIKPAGQKPMTFNPQIISLVGYELVWLGKVWFSGIFDGRHSFLLKEISPNQTKFIHCETFSGILSGLIFSWIGKSTIEGFEGMNQALKQKCEAIDN